MKRSLPLLIMLFLLWACSRETDQSCAPVPEISEHIQIEFSSVIAEIDQLKTKEQVADFLRGNPVLRDFFYNRMAYPDDSAFVRELHSRFNNPAFDTLIMEVRQTFGDGTALKKDFENAFSNLKYYYPEFRAPKIITAISGLETDLVFSDTLIVIGLDYFLGSKAKYRPNMYQYMLTRYQPDYIVPEVLLLYGIGEPFNKVNSEDHTALADMVAYGKAYLFTRHLISCIPDSTLFGYSAAEVNGARANEDIIWEKFISDQVLYETSHLVKQRYLGERPNTGEISERCPGRIGMWVGLRILEQYQRANDKTLQQVMEEPDAMKIFKASRYKPLGR
jgi:hypothetical protein